MKDERLEKEFEEYFKGVNTPNGITDGAKKFAVRKNRVLPKIAKYASIAASFVIVFAAAVALILRGGFRAALPSAPDASPEAPSSPSHTITTYGYDGLEQVATDAHSATAVDGSLKFIQKLAFAQNAAVDGLNAYYSEDTLTLVQTEVSFISGLNRYDATVYVEYTDESVVLEGLESYYEGIKVSYGGADYYVTEGVAVNGEPQFKLIINKDSVKYYFDIRSSDEEAYMKYVQLILNN